MTNLSPVSVRSALCEFPKADQQLSDEMMKSIYDSKASFMTDECGDNLFIVKDGKIIAKANCNTYHIVMNWTMY